WKTVWRASSGSWNGPTGSWIWITSLRWKSRSAARVTFSAARHPAWRARCFKPAASPCHRRYAHAELTFSSAQAERKRVTRPFSKLQPAGNERLPPTWCRRWLHLSTQVPLPLVPPGTVLRAPGALPKAGRMSWLLRGRCGRWGWFWSRGGVCGQVLLLGRVLRAAWRGLDV